MLRTVTPPTRAASHPTAGRGPRARAAILEAADDVLVEKGFTATTIEGIAARAGVAKQTIYRWWSSKADLLLDCLIDDAGQDLPPFDTGSSTEDLSRELLRFAEFLEQPAGRVLRSCAPATSSRAESSTARSCSTASPAGSSRPI